VLFLGIAAVALSVEAWAGLVAALLLAAVQFVVAARLSAAASQTGGAAPDAG
jgi:hypothetical protein